jgi:Tol biopolymer transport system component
MQVLLIILLFTNHLFSQSFGKNKVQYDTFDWEYVVSPNTNVYYYGDNNDLAIFTSKVAEKSLEQIGKHLRWRSNKPIKIIIYSSHNDFQQTNVVNVYMSEGIGGVTELYKNRIVIPFEGSYKQFEHVIHHELVHAAINELVYGGNAQGLISGRILLQVPLWANEGLAEFLSVNWDSNADMVLRDLAIEERLPSIPELNYSILAYKGGQSVWQYITQKYGREKVGEIFLQMRRTQSAERGFKNALGVDFEKLTDDWHNFLKREYWPDLVNRENFDDFSTKITDRSKTKNFYNVSPSFSPDGNTVAYFTDQNGYMDLILYEIGSERQKKRLIRGNNSPDFEELKWLQPGISWSPDGKFISFASKSGEQDSIIIVNVKTGKYKKIPIDLDGVFTTSWHPSEDKIAFMGHKDDSSDIFVINLNDKKIVNITNDIFSEASPSWSPDGSKIYFTSDRGRNSNVVSMYDIDFSQTDIYEYNTESKIITQITNSDVNENYPIADTNGNLFYTSDYNGVTNIFKYNISKKEAFPITNVITGIQQIDIDKNNNIIFSGYKERGWDLYLMNNIDQISKKEVKETKFFSENDYNNDFEDLRFFKKNNLSTPKESYDDYIFAKNYKYKNSNDKEAEKTEIDSLRFQDNFVARKYKTDFSVDYISTAASIDNLFGTRGVANVAWSDVMGDHRINLSTNLVIDLDNSDLLIQYAYLKKRTNLYTTLFQQSNTFALGYDLNYDYFGQLRDYGVGFFGQYPFSKFSRIDFGATLRSANYTVRQFNIFTYEFNTRYEENLRALVPLTSFVYDNSTNGYTGPIDGFKQYLTFQFSPDIGSNSVPFKSLKFDIRKYFRINRNYSIATRLMLGKSSGDKPQKFFLGGNSQMMIFSDTQTEGRDDSGFYAQRVLEYDNTSILEDVYFSEYVFPLRGARYRERVGENVAVANFEFRFPFVNYVDVSFPARIRFGNIFGHLFLDVGAAWDSSDEFDNSELVRIKYGSTDPKASPVLTTFGFGTKIFTRFALIRIDAAWDKYPSGGYSKPQYIVSLGYDW